MKVRRDSKPFLEVVSLIDLSVEALEQLHDKLLSDSSVTETTTILRYK